MRRNSAALLASILVLAVAACSAPSSDGGPEQTLQEFFRQINDGDYASAMTLYSSEALELWEDPAIAGDSSFEDWAKSQTKSGSVDRVTVVDKSEGEKTAKLEFEVVYSDGAKARHTVELVQEDGLWKMGLIS
jgi:hypothetical protein